MKTYTKSELQELKKIRNYFGEHDKTSFEHSAFAFLDKLINSATEEVGIKEDDLIEDAVNAYYHQIVKELERKDLGDIERMNLEGIKQKCKNYFTSQIHPQPSASLASHKD